MLEAIVFDIGNVLLRFDFNRAIERIAPFCGVPIPEIPQKMEPLKMDLESGRLAGEAFLATLEQVLEYGGDRQLLKQAWQEIFEPIEATHQLVAHLSSRVPLFLLSNTNDLHTEYFLARYEVFKHFQDAVYSHEAGLMKPDLAIYKHALKRFKLSGEKLLFIDDLAPNVDAAQAAGWNTHLYHEGNHAALLKQLGEHGVL